MKQKTHLVFAPSLNATKIMAVIKCYVNEMITRKIIKFVSILLLSVFVLNCLVNGAVIKSNYKSKQFDKENHENELNTSTNYSSFSCFNRFYGLYADISSNCVKFFECQQFRDPINGHIEFQRLTFQCENSRFDQKQLACVDQPSISCKESEDYYEESNKMYSEGKLPDIIPHGFVMPKMLAVESRIFFENGDEMLDPDINGS